MFSIAILILVLGSVNGCAISLDNVCNVEFGVLVDCTGLHEEFSEYRFSYYDDKIQRMEFTRLRGVINLANLPGVELIKVETGEVSCENFE